MSFKQGYDLTKAVRATVRNGPVDIAVAYWGPQACRILQLPEDLSQYRIICDARSGFCSADALGELLARGAEVLDLPMLHAKVYRSKTTMVIASANASHRGLPAIKAPPGLEAGFVVRDKAQLKEAKNWFDAARKVSEKISASDLPAIRDLWESQRASRPLRLSLLDALLKQSPDISGRRLRVYVYTAETPECEHLNKFAQSDFFSGEQFDETAPYPFFWGEMASSIELGNEHLCFEVGKQMVRCEGVWKILAKIGVEAGAVWPAAHVDLPLGRPLGSDRVINTRVADAISRGAIFVDSEPLTLEAFSAAICSSGSSEMANHLAIIQAEPVRSAYQLLVQEMSILGLAMRFKTGQVPAVEWQNERGRRPFSFIPNGAHLLFYLRKPALTIAPHLGKQARLLGFQTRRNSREEETFRITNVAEARQLVALLRENPSLL